MNVLFNFDQVQLQQGDLVWQLHLSREAYARIWNETTMSSTQVCRMEFHMASFQITAYRTEALLQDLYVNHGIIRVTKIIVSLYYHSGQDIINLMNLSIEQLVVTITDQFIY